MYIFIHICTCIFKHWASKLHVHVYYMTCKCMFTKTSFFTEYAVLDVKENENWKCEFCRPDILIMSLTTFLYLYVHEMHTHSQWLVGHIRAVLTMSA